MNPRIRRHGASAFLGYWPMEATYSLLMPVATICAARGLSPNLFSWACLGLGFASGVVAALGGLCLGGALVLAAGCCDALDGMVARLSNVASEAGEVLDAAADRYSEAFFLSGLIIWYRSDVVAMTLALAALVGSLMVSYSQAKADAMRVVVPPYWMRRPERVSYLGGAAMLSPLEPRYLMLAVLALVGVLANATVMRRCVFLYAILARPREARAGGRFAEAPHRPDRERAPAGPEQS
jgi:CDP-diacylglycerol---glycerol-3-phosphate 3-phosphatidyltransferase